MKKIFFAVLFFVTGTIIVSCGSDKSSTDQAIDIIEEAIVKVEDANSIEELDAIQYEVLMDIEKCGDDTDEYKSEAELIEEAGRINKAFTKLEKAIKKKVAELE